MHFYCNLNDYLKEKRVYKFYLKKPSTVYGKDWFELV